MWSPEQEIGRSAQWNREGDIKKSNQYEIDKIAMRDKGEVTTGIKQTNVKTNENNKGNLEMS